jgi:hypothetical protein
MADRGGKVRWLVPRHFLHSASESDYKIMRGSKYNKIRSQWRFHSELSIMKKEWSMFRHWMWEIIDYTAWIKAKISDYCTPRYKLLFSTSNPISQQRFPSPHNHPLIITPHQPVLTTQDNCSGSPNQNTVHWPHKSFFNLHIPSKAGCRDRIAHWKNQSYMCKTGLSHDIPWCS